MSAVKTFALGVLVTGILAAPTRAGSMQVGQQPPILSDGRMTSAPTSLILASSPSMAAENLAGSLGVTNGGTPYVGSGNAWGALTLGTSVSNRSTAVTNAPASNPPAPSPPAADAFINFGSGPYLEAGSLTTGNAQPFFDSPAFTGFFPNATSADIASFENQVIATIQKTYADAGLSVHLTTDPTTLAAHTMSVVSGLSNPQSPGAIGITDVGNNGFSFIDKFGDAQTPVQLATAIGHNVAHELMHAFGLANHPETNGPYVDAATTTFANLSDPKTDFSPAAASLLSTLNFQATGQSITSGAQHIDGDQILVPLVEAVPEPTTLALWGLVGGVAMAARRRRKSARSAVGLRRGAGSR